MSTKAKTYTSEQKQRAIDIYVEKGRAAAEQETGTNGKTIASWVSRAGRSTDAGTKRKAAVEAARDEMALRRERIKKKLAIRCEWALDMVDKEFTKIVVDQRGGVHEITATPEPAEAKHYAMTAGIFFDKLQLATGGPTSTQTIQPPSLTALVEAQREKNQEIKAELQRAAEAQEGDI